jgi:hypothetical protein
MTFFHQIVSIEIELMSYFFEKLNIGKLIGKKLRRIKSVLKVEKKFFFLLKLRKKGERTFNKSNAS